MILQITHPAQLAGPVGQDLIRCVRRYCEKANDGMTPEDLISILPQRVYPEHAPPTAWLFLGFDDKVRVRAFALVRAVHDIGLGWALDLWHVYMDPQAPPDLMADGLKEMVCYFGKRGITRFQFASSRSVDGRAWQRLLKDYGFKETAVVLELNTKEVLADGIAANRPAIILDGNPGEQAVRGTTVGTADPTDEPAE